MQLARISHPQHGIAGRFLRHGRTAGVDGRRKRAANIDAEKSRRVAEKRRKGQFDLADMREEAFANARWGNQRADGAMMPGIAKMKNQIQCRHDGQDHVKRKVRIIDSMTRNGGKNPIISRRSRQEEDRAGAGRRVEESQQAC